MFILLFVACVCLMLHNKLNIIPLYLICSVWVNTDVRLGVGGVSFIFALSFVGIILLSTCKRTCRTAIDHDVKSFFIYYFSIILLFILLSSGMGVLSQLNAVKSSLAILLGLFIWKARIDKRKIHVWHKYVYVALLAVCIYGVFSYVTGTNIYIDLIKDYCTSEKLAEVAVKSKDDGRGLLKGRISGTSLYTIQYGILMCICFYYVFFVNTIKDNVANVVLMFLIFVNVYLTGSRGPLFALILALLFYFLRKSTLKTNIKYALWTGFIILCFSQILIKYFSFMVSDDVQGSSVEGRSVQFLGALSIVQDNWRTLLFGKGFSYISEYIAKNGPHPLALYFESTHVSGIVTYGIMGLIFIFLGSYVLMSYLVWRARKERMIDRNKSILLFSYVMLSMLYGILVGNVYTQLHIITFFILLKYSVVLHQTESEQLVND